MATTYGRQISTLVQHRSERSTPSSSSATTGHAASSERTLRQIGRVGQSVNLAIERFVTVGETIADDNPEIKQGMYEACKDARSAGSSIERLCEIAANDLVSYQPHEAPLSENGSMVRAAKALLTSVTRVLLLADTVVVKQLLVAKDRVYRTLGILESVANFTEFVKAFSIFGAEMVELAHLTGDRQNDLKDERRRAQMAGLRQVLERSTMILLTSSKTCLRHPECTNSRENRDTVFGQMRRAMEKIHNVVKDGVIESSNERMSSRQSIADWDPERATAFTYLRQFSRLVEMSRPRFESGSCNNSDQRNNDQRSCDQRVINNNSIEKSSQNGGCGFSKSPAKEMAGDGGRRERELMRSNSERDKHIGRPGRHKDRNYGCMDSIDREINNIPTTSSNARCRGDLISNHSVSILAPETREQLLISLDRLVEKTQDFTDSAYTTHEHRENILLLCDRTKLELNQLLRVAINLEKYPNCDIDTALDSVLSAIQDLSHQLTITTIDHTAELSHIVKSGIELVNSLRNIALNQDLDRLQEKSERFHDFIDHMLEVCKLLRHIALTETLQVQAIFTETNLRVYGPQVITAARALSSHPSSKIATENLEVFVDMWQWLASDISCVSKEVIELTQSLSRSQPEYQSLPRPGKHGTTSKPLKPSRLDPQEQEKIAKAGLEMKELTNEMDAETDKWNGADGTTDENNDIVKRAKSMSNMAFSMYQFTKGEGSLRTTQDLFTQAEYFAEEANSLYKVVRQFSYQVPAGDNKKELLEHLDRVPTFVQTLQFTVKDPTVGKAATFVKVDHVIQETKNLMNVINKVVTKCFECANKYKLDFSGLAGRMASGSSRDDEGGSGAAGDSKGSTSNTEASM